MVTTGCLELISGTVTPTFVAFRKRHCYRSGRQKVPFRLEIVSLPGNRPAPATGPAGPPLRAVSDFRKRHSVPPERNIYPPGREVFRPEATFLPPGREIFALSRARARVRACVSLTSSDRNRPSSTDPRAHTRARDPPRAKRVTLPGNGTVPAPTNVAGTQPPSPTLPPRGPQPGNQASGVTNGIAPAGTVGNAGRRRHPPAPRRQRQTGTPPANIQGLGHNGKKKTRRRWYH